MLQRRKWSRGPAVASLAYPGKWAYGIHDGDAATTAPNASHTALDITPSWPTPAAENLTKRTAGKRIIGSAPEVQLSRLKGTALKRKSRSLLPVSAHSSKESGLGLSILASLTGSLAQTLLVLTCLIQFRTVL